LHSLQGATCDFGGVAVLERRDVLDTDDEFDDDWNDDSIIVVKGFSTTKVVYIAVFGSLLGGFIGFTIAMKTSKRFNVAVRKSIVGKSFRNNKMFLGENSFFGAKGMPVLDDDGDYDEIQS